LIPRVLKRGVPEQVFSDLAGSRPWELVPDFDVAWESIIYQQFLAVFADGNRAHCVPFVRDDNGLDHLLAGTSVTPNIMILETSGCDLMTLSISSDEIRPATRPRWVVFFLLVIK